MRAACQAETIQLIKKAREAAAREVSEETAFHNQGHLWFTQPEVPQAGAPLTVYFNAGSSENLRGCEEVSLVMGFNGWSMPEHTKDLAMRQVELPVPGGDQWWAVTVDQVPHVATQANFVISGDGGATWENNGGEDFLHEVLGGPGVDEGHVTVHELQGPDSRGPIHIRVWTPPGFDKSNAPPGGYPVVYLNDGQNLFDDNTAFGGKSWRAGHAVSWLMKTGRLPPTVVVGIDNREVNRGWDYTPYPCGSGREGFRSDAADWPGGGVWFYLQWVVQKVLPLAEAVYGCSTDPRKRVFGGASLGGICSLCCAMKCSDVFGGILAESPQFWISEGRFLNDLKSYNGKWPDKIFMATGTKEFSGTRPDVEEGDKFDDWLVEYAETGQKILEQHTLKAQNSRLLFMLEQGAALNERDWSRRLPGALEFLLSHTWDL